MIAKNVSVDLGSRSYDIRIAPGLLSEPGALAPHIGGPDVLIVSNETVAPLYEAPLRRALGECRAERIALPDGEQHKTLASVATLYDALVAMGANRDTTIVALGGGVVGDIAGFAAASYQRGVRFVQVPTTLLAQVDSSVGGKTGVNHPAGKNLIGAFHQPAHVLIDTTTLATLPPREYAAGLAEVIKYGVLGDSAFLAWLEANMGALCAARCRRGYRGDLPLVPREGRYSSRGRDGTRPARAAEPRPYLWPRDRSGGRLWRVAARRGGRRRDGHGCGGQRPAGRRYRPAATAAGSRRPADGAAAAGWPCAVAGDATRQESVVRPCAARAAKGIGRCVRDGRL